MAAEETKEGIYFEDPSNELSPGEPSLSNELGGGLLVGVTGGGLRLGQGASSAMERGIGSRLEVCFERSEELRA